MRSGPRPATLASIAAVALATFAAIALKPGSVGAAVAPAAVGLLALAFLRAPLRLLALGLLFAALALENPSEAPFSAAWTPPWHGLSEALFLNLKHTLGLSALSFSTLDLAIGLLALRALGERWTGHAAAEPGWVPAAPVLLPAVLAGLAGMLLAEAWGLSQGGNLRMSLWQVRQLLATPLLVVLFLSALRGPRDDAALAGVVIAAACAKALAGIFFELAIRRPQELEVPYVTSHGDSVLFVAATVFALLLWLGGPRRSGRLALATVPLLLVAMVFNNRRLAYVELAACLLAGYLLMPRSRHKRALSLAALAAAPLLAGYVAAGLTSRSRVFAPVHAFQTIGAEGDTSSTWRDEENENLMLTLRQGGLLGAGFGREYVERNPEHDISDIYAEYRYVPHNSIIGLWAFAGAAFALIWLPLVVGLFLAVRSGYRAAGQRQRTAALACVCVYVIFVAQAWGDMGLQAWQGALLLSATLAFTAKLAVAVGAWPAPSAARRSHALPEVTP